MKYLNSSVALLLVGAASAFNFEKHPVRQEVIDRIKATQTSWTPAELDSNPLSKITLEQINMRGGNLGFKKTENILDESIKTIQTQILK